MTLYTAIVDIEATLINHCATDSTILTLAGLSPGGVPRVSSELRKDYLAGSTPWLQLLLSNTTETDPATGHLNRHLVDVFAHGPTKGEAWALMVAANTALRAAPGESHPTGVVTSVERVTGPAWLPDPVTDGPRYVSTFAITAHAHPTG